MRPGCRCAVFDDGEPCDRCYFRGVAYELHHVDAGCHEPFPLACIIPLTPAPIVPVSNVTRVHHRAGEAFVLSGPRYPRVLLKGDWS